MKKFGEKLCALRKRRGLSQTQLGDLLDVDQSYVGRMEKGERIPNIAMLLKISDIFGVIADQLIRDELELD